MTAVTKIIRALSLLTLPLVIGVASVLPVLAQNPDDSGQVGRPPCYVQGRSYAAPYAGQTSYSWTSTGCPYNPWGARLETYFWDGGWWGIVVTHPNFAYYQRTLYSAAVEGWHQNFFIISPYAYQAHTYASD